MLTAHRRFHFEDFWLRLDGFHDTVAAAWGSVHDPNPFHRLMLRFQAMARRLTSWSAKTTGSIRDKLAISRELISRFGKAQEDRALTPEEDWLRKRLKVSYLGLASLERTIARQRARIATLKDGNASTGFFHRQCSFHRQKNRIFSLAVDGHTLTDQDAMAQVAFEHFGEILGTAADRDLTLNLEGLIEPCDLASLDAPFSVEEVWDAIKRLPARKAPGLDGFTAEFLRACWTIIRQDLMDVFQQLFEMRGRFVANFQGTHNRPPAAGDLRRIKQQLGETLQKYIQRFNNTRLKIPKVTDEACAATAAHEAQPPSLRGCWAACLNRRPWAQQGRISGALLAFVCGPLRGPSPQLRPHALRPAERGVSLSA